MSEVNDAGERLDVRSVITAQLESTKYEADGWALCCSGGGYKSGAFQVGAFIRLNELGVLRKLKRISSVSGGSIASAYLGLRWNDLEWHHGVATNFDDVFVAPMTRFFYKRQSGRGGGCLGSTATHERRQRAREGVRTQPVRRSDTTEPSGRFQCATLCGACDQFRA